MSESKAILPNKEYFRFNEVTSLLDIRPYVLRFWETEFPEIISELRDDGEKYFSKEALEIVQSIKELLFIKNLSIEEAKAELQYNQNRKEDVLIQSESETQYDMKAIINRALLRIDEVIKNNNW